VDIECVGVTLLSDTLQSIGLTESVDTRVQGWFRKKPMDLCVSENEEHEDGVGSGVNTTLLCIVNKSRRICTGRVKVWLPTKPMNYMDLCVSESEEYEDGVGSGVNVIIMSDD
jgi:hypothetical protein